MSKKHEERKDRGSQTQQKIDQEKNRKSEKVRKDYGSYSWVDPKTKLLYAKVRIPTGEFYANGKPKYKVLTKRAKNKTNAADKAQDILKEHEERGGGFLVGREMTFQKLADWYRDEYLIEARYVNGAKVAGMRKWEAESGKPNAANSTASVKNLARCCLKTLTKPF